MPQPKEAPMTQPHDAVLAYWSEHRDQLRQSENQRAVLTNYLLEPPRIWTLLAN